MRIDIVVTDDGTEAGAEEALDTASYLYDMCDYALAGVVVNVEVHEAGQAPVPFVSLTTTMASIAELV